MTDAEEPAAQPPIDVLLANLDGALPEPVVELLGRQPDIRVVGQAQGAADLLLRASEGVDVVIVGVAQADPLPGICTHLLAEHPDLRVITLAAGKSAMVYWLGLRRRQLRSVSASNLISFLRQAHRLNPTE